MIKIENVVLPSSDQWRAIIMGCRNPMNSWHKSDTCFSDIGCHECDLLNPDSPKCTMTKHGNGHRIGEDDLTLMYKLSNAGSDHRKYMRMIIVYLDVTAPLYWWKEMDTYTVGKVQNSCSTMHKIHAKEFTLDDFSHEHLLTEYGDPSMNLNYSGQYPEAVLRDLIHVLNNFRTWFLETKDKRYWWQMIQLLPTSYNQKRTVMLNYEVLRNIYISRKNHKLDEWRELCEWIESLPYSEIITLEENDAKS